MAENFVIRQGLKVLENVSLPTTTVTANHTVADGEHTIVYDGSGAGVITLPDPASYPGRRIVVKNLNTTEGVRVDVPSGKYLDKTQNGNFSIRALDDVAFPPVAGVARARRPRYPTAGRRCDGWPASSRAGRCDRTARRRCRRD